jgi:hypothetical protein
LSQDWLNAKERSLWGKLTTVAFLKSMYSSQFLYCRNCNFKTHHRYTLKYDWGYSCDICGTWQHQCILPDIQQGYAAKIIQDSLAKDEIKWCNGTLEELIEHML